MEYAIVIVVISSLASGALGVWLGFKFYGLQLLALEKQTELAFTCMEDRVNELQRVATRNQTRDAVNMRWKKKDETDEATLKELHKIKPASETLPMPGFDPVKWMNGL
jgi:type II secretory pathway pseudopilin PulG